MEHLSARIEQKIRLTPTVFMVKLQLEGDQKIQFQAGQYVHLEIPIGAGKVIRPFSIASSPQEKSHIELLVKIIEGGIASTFFETVPIGTPLALQGPEGTFTIQTPPGPLCFIAASTGIAPFRSMLSGLFLQENTTTPVHLSFVLSSREELFLEQELHTFAQHHKNFSYTIVFTKQNGLNPPQQHFLAHLQMLPARPDTHFYLCGGASFINDITQILTQRGIARERIHLEEFK
ncbi:FAD-dependent oxidoreductase [Patescibacteria group bacterium]|nr:FAD-dependent oxidoreductase [Patescibacteria group bacterium]